MSDFGYIYEIMFFYRFMIYPISGTFFGWLHFIAISSLIPDFEYIG